LPQEKLSPTCKNPRNINRIQQIENNRYDQITARGFGRGSCSKKIRGKIHFAILVVKPAKHQPLKI
jgi:hypothetical protein